MADNHGVVKYAQNWLKKQRTFERLLAPNQWKIIEGIKVENTTKKVRRVIITIPEGD